MTSDVDRELLLRIARAAIAGHVGAGAPATIDAGEMSRRLGGAFVTLHRGNDLRGCIGHIEADEPLPEVVARCAVEACSSDPRFPPVTAAELPEIEIELSLLGPLEPIEGPADIEVGRHGLVVERGWHRGLLLPQVATERKWDSEKFVAQTCHKAGLPPDAWRHGAKVWRFEAEVFGE
jgi:uncharacterized protein